MDLTAQNLEVVWITIIVLSCLSCWTTQEILFRRIKKLNYEKWVEIGEPGFISALSPNLSKFKKAFKTLRYFTKGDTVLDSDPKTLKLKKLVKTVYLAVLIVVVAFFVAVFIINPE
ncbi:MAG TPA: hypothetical protein PK109_00830 [Candidatus Paceibacterota bacterium]|nr:hypothetical protein [Candidatus Paceibacterota bacterium]